MALIDQHDLTHQLRHHLRGQAARHLDRDTLGQRIARARQVGAVQLVVHAGEQLGLDADDLDRLVRRRRDRGDAEIRPPPPIGTISVSISGASSSISSATVPWPAITRIVEGMDEGIAALRLQLAGMGIGGVEIVALQHHGRAVTLGLDDLHDRRGARHHDGGGMPSRLA